MSFKKTGEAKPLAKDPVPVDTGKKSKKKSEEKPKKK